LAKATWLSDLHLNRLVVFLRMICDADFLLLRLTGDPPAGFPPPFTLLSHDTIIFIVRVVAPEISPKTHGIAIELYALLLAAI
jgi:hypothetical protein